MFFVGWERQYKENSHSYGQLVMGSFIKTTYLLVHQSHTEYFGKTLNHPGDSVPLKPRFSTLKLLAFSKTKIKFEREEISDCWWNSGKYEKVADGDSNKRFCRVFSTVEETLGELCEVPRCLRWRGLRHHFQIYNISCILYLLQWTSLFFTVHGRILSGQTLYITYI